MKKKKILFIASLPTKKLNFDGERNKSKDVLNALKKKDNYSISVINYSKNKYLQSLKMCFLHTLRNFDYIFISKCIVGGSKALHMLRKIKKTENVYFYIIGNGYFDFNEKDICFKDITFCKKVIVESDVVKDSMILKGVKESNIGIFPCLKPTYNISVKEKEYQNDQPLKLLFFSRINPKKGLKDLLDVVIEINSNQKEPLFYLDIAGGVSNEPGIQEFSEEVIQTCNEYPFLNYLGMSLRINGLDSYKIIQNYDLHVFPSKFNQECAPGSILDMFVAGVPTLSSTFPSYSNLINHENSFLFEQNNKEDLKEKLLDIYHHSSETLNKRRKLSHLEYFKYTDDSFIKFLSSIQFE